MTVSVVQANQSPSGSFGNQLATVSQPVSPHTPGVTREDIDWATKLDKKMEYGYVPSDADQQRYNMIIGHLKAVRDGGGYVYKDTTSFSSNPRGFSAIGSLVGRTLSGGYVGYRYSNEMATITHDTFVSVKDGISQGHFGEAFKGLAGGLKSSGIIAVKAGGISSAINAATSLVSNTFETIAGRETASEAVGNVGADTVGGFLSGIGASIFSGVSTLGLSLAGTAGLPLTIIGVAGGAVGSVLIDKAYKGAGLFSIIKGKITSVLDSKFNKTHAVSASKFSSQNPNAVSTTNASLLPVATQTPGAQTYAPQASAQPLLPTMPAQPMMAPAAMMSPAALMASSRAAA